ncbi:MAG: O-antigen ligase [Candidatus Poriferisodalaceae bacterium]
MSELAVPSVFLGLVVGGATLSAPRLAAGSSPGDVLLIGAIGLAFVLIGPRKRSRLRMQLRPMLLPVSLVLVGSVLPLVGIGIPAWAVLALGTELYLLVGAFAVLALLLDPRVSLHWVGVGVMPALLFSSWVGIFQGHSVLLGWYPKPNLNAHAVVVIGYCTWLVLRSPVLRRITIVAAALGVLGSASFGAMLSAGAAVAVLILFQMRGVRRLLVIAVVALSLLVLVVPARSLIEDRTTSENASSEITSDRFDRSATGRVDIWRSALRSYPDQPLGLGPYAWIERGGGDVELHNDYISFLVERGPLGLIGLLLCCLTLFRMTRWDPSVGAFVAMAMVAGLFRETLHYRHLWVGLAMVLAASLRYERDRSQGDVDSDVVPAL